MNARELFQANKDLAPWWKGVVEDPRFQAIMLYASKAMLDETPTREQQDGAKMAIRILTDFADVDDSAMPMPRLNIHHMAEKLPPRPGGEPPTPKE